MARYFARGLSKVYWVTTISSLSAPTVAEITAGVNLTPGTEESIAEITGFDFQQNPIGVPDFSGTFDAQIGGPDTTGNSSLTFYDTTTTRTVRTALAKGTSGFLVFMDLGFTATKKAEVWPAQSLGTNQMRTLGAEAAKFQVPFAITATPTQSATITA